MMRAKKREKEGSENLYPWDKSYYQNLLTQPSHSNDVSQFSFKRDSLSMACLADD